MRAPVLGLVPLLLLSTWTGSATTRAAAGPPPLAATRAQAGSGATELSSAATAPTSPVTAPTVPSAPAPGSLPRAKLRLELQPRTAVAAIRTAELTSVTGASGQTVVVPAGRVDVVISAPGYQPRTETLSVPAAGITLARRLDPVGQLLRWRAEVKTGSNPKQVAFTPNGQELWVPLLGSRGVDVFRTADGTRLTTIRVGNDHGAVEVVFNKAGTRAYVSQMETASVYELDVARHTVLRRMSTGGNWTKVMALSPDETTLYAANWVSNDVSVLELATGKLLQRIPTVKTPRGLAFDPTGTRLFVAGFDGGEIQRITLATGEKATLLRTGGAMRHLVVDATKNVIYADDMGTSGLYVVDLATEKVTQLATVDSHPNTIDLAPDGRFVYVSNRGQNNAKGYNLPGPEWGDVLVIDTATGKAVDAVIGGNQTTGLDVSPDGHLLAFTDFLDNRLSLYEIPPASVLEHGNGGLAPKRRPLIVK